MQKKTSCVAVAGAADTVYPRPRAITQGTGADFHRAMMATAPGEKLLIGRRHMKNWTNLQFFLCYTVNYD